MSIIEHPEPGSPRIARATLQELALVLLLCGVTLALTSQVVSVLRGRQSGAICLSNLRRIGQATSLYLHDNDETFPAAWSGCVSEDGWQFVAWPKTLEPYTSVTIAPGERWANSGGALWHCPADFNGDNISYATNAAIAGAFARRDCHTSERSASWQNARSLSTIVAPERVLWAGDTNKEWLADEERSGAVFADWMRPTDAPLLNRTPTEVREWYTAYLHTDYTDNRGDCPYAGRYGCKALAYRHNRTEAGTGSASVLFCDGHAAAAPFGTLTTDNFFPQEATR